MERFIRRNPHLVLSSDIVNEITHEQEEELQTRESIETESSSLTQSTDLVNDIEEEEVMERFTPLDIVNEIEEMEVQYEQSEKDDNTNESRKRKASCSEEQCFKKRNKEQNSQGLFEETFVRNDSTNCVQNSHGLLQDQFVLSEATNSEQNSDGISEEKNLNTILNLHGLPEVESCIFEEISDDEELNRVLRKIPSQVGSGGRAMKFTITERPGLFNKKFNIRELLFNIKLNEELIGDGWRQRLSVLTEAIETALEMAQLNESDLVRLFINQRGLQTPFVLDFRSATELTVESILEHIEKLLQSKESLTFDSTFVIHVAVVRLVRGGRGKKIINLKNLIGKKSVVTIGNTDNMCLARALVVCRAHVLNDPRYNYIKRTDRPLQTRLAADLCKKAGVNTHIVSSLADVNKFEKQLNTKICVISADAMNKVIYRGSRSINSDVMLFVYHHHKHFDAIVNVVGFYGYGYFCFSCLVPYYANDRHNCSQKCVICHRFDCEKKDTKLCKICNRICNNEECFRIHKKENADIVTGKKLKSACSRFWRCLHCNTTMKKSRKNNHQCGEIYCKFCNLYYLGEHRCYIMPRDAPKPNFNYIFFDLETIQVTGVHVPNLCVAHRVCEQCIEVDDIDHVCLKCGERQHVFQGDECSEAFCSWLFSEQHKDYTCIAHNLKGFDGMFLLKYLVKNGYKPEVIFNGSKIMYLHVSIFDIRLIDSLNHLPMSLANLPKAFGLSAIRKGYFPHYFNTPENQTYLGPIPDTHFYGADDMSPENRKSFLEWHAEQKVGNKLFDFQKEILAYCVSDVDILRKCCLKFRSLILAITKKTRAGKPVHGVDPFTQITIASVCFTVFRHLFLRSDTIARVPGDGITFDHHSKLSIMWLEWLVHSNTIRGHPLRIEHALNVGEKCLEGYKVDGWDPINEKCFEFHGCYWHGCPECYRADTMNEKLGSTMGFLFEKTRQKRITLEGLGYTYVCVWECHFKKEMANNENLRSFAANQDIQSRLDPRDSFTGGRVNGTRLYYETLENEKILYSDFISLYPSQNKYGIYPIGYPEIIVRNFQPVETYVGFVKLKILPPRGLYHPLLPYRINDKLTFPLCKTCAENECASCHHSEKERAFIGTYVTLEIKKALELGYKVIKIYEVYHFPPSQIMQYDGANPRSGLFTTYINTFLKIKQEASGFPSWVKSRSDEQKYIEDYKHHEGISLDRSKISKNPGLRSVAKLCLNSFWGKFGQRTSNLKKSTFVTELADFYELLFDPAKRVVDIHILTEEMVLVDWVDREHHEQTVASSNVYIASFTTAQARLKLYSVLEQVGRRALYFDTDSIIYVSRPGEKDPPTGDYLGQLTSELSDGEHIERFVCGGPKNYAFLTNTGREVCKVRGFTLNFRNSGVINFSTVSDLIKNSKDGCVCTPLRPYCNRCSARLTIVNPRKICRDKLSMEIYNREERKDYRVVYTKRVILDNFDTLPYGY